MNVARPFSPRWISVKILSILVVRNEYFHDRDDRPDIRELKSQFASGKSPCLVVRPNRPS